MEKRRKKRAKRQKLLASPAYNSTTYGPQCWAQRESARRMKEWTRKQTSKNNAR